MKRLLVIAALLTLLLPATKAQSLRLGERIPELQIFSEGGEQYVMGKHVKEYVYMIFVHSESTPCLSLIERLNNVDRELFENITVILITPEDPNNNATIHERFTNNMYPITYDLEYRTLKNFGVSFVPFGVLYNTKRKRTVWFGSTLLFDDTAIEKIL